MYKCLISQNSHNTMLLWHEPPSSCLLDSHEPLRFDYMERAADITMTKTCIGLLLLSQLTTFVINLIKHRRHIYSMILLFVNIRTPVVLSWHGSIWIVGRGGIFSRGTSVFSIYHGHYKFWSVNWGLKQNLAIPDPHPTRTRWPLPVLATPCWPWRIFYATICVQRERCYFICIACVYRVICVSCWHSTLRVYDSWL